MAREVTMGSFAMRAWSQLGRDAPPAIADVAFMQSTEWSSVAIIQGTEPSEKMLEHSTSFPITFTHVTESFKPITVDTGGKDDFVNPTPFLIISWAFQLFTIDRVELADSSSNSGAEPDSCPNSLAISSCGVPLCSPYPVASDPGGVGLPLAGSGAVLVTELFESSELEVLGLGFGSRSTWLWPVLPSRIPRRWGVDGGDCPPVGLGW